MITLKIVTLAVLFVVSGGAIATDAFKKHKSLALLAAVVALVGSYYVGESLYADLFPSKSEPTSASRPGTSDDHRIDAQPQAIPHILTQKGMIDRIIADSGTTDKEIFRSIDFGDTGSMKLGQPLDLSGFDLRKLSDRVFEMRGGFGGASEIQFLIDIEPSSKLGCILFVYDSTTVSAKSAEYRDLLGAGLETGGVKFWRTGDTFFFISRMEPSRRTYSVLGDVRHCSV